MSAGTDVCAAILSIDGTLTPVDGVNENILGIAAVTINTVAAATAQIYLPSSKVLQTNQAIYLALYLAGGTAVGLATAQLYLVQ